MVVWFLNNIYIGNYGLCHLYIADTPGVNTARLRQWKTTSKRYWINKSESKNKISSDTVRGMSWEPEGCWCSPKMFRWEPEGRYGCTKSIWCKRAPLCFSTFSTEYRWTTVMPFWLSCSWHIQGCLKEFRWFSKIKLEMQQALTMNYSKIEFITLIVTCNGRSWL